MNAGNSNEGDFTYRYKNPDSQIVIKKMEYEPDGSEKKESMKAEQSMDEDFIDKIFS